MRAKCYHRDPLSTAQDPRELIEAYYRAGWTNGLPVVPPSDASIEQMLAAGGWRGDEVIGGSRAATPPHIGVRPEPEP
jgi:hypothetical protein